MRRAYLARAAVAVLALAGGGAVGVCVVVLHSFWWGLLLGVVTTAALLVAVPGGWWRRLPFALGWTGAVALLSAERPEGDYLVKQSASGYLLLGAAVVVLLGGVVGLRHHQDPEAAINGSATPVS